MLPHQMVSKPDDLQIICLLELDKQTDIFNRAFNFSLVLVLELVLVTHHQVGVRHTQLHIKNDQKANLIIKN